MVIKMLRIKPKLKFERFNFGEDGVLYGSFSFGKIEYSLKEFLELLTPDQLIQLKHRIDNELEIRMSD